MKYLMLGAAALALTACAQDAPAEVEEAATPAEETQADATEMDAAEPAMSASEKLEAALAAQSDEAKARYPHRHPKETLEFFGVMPGMTVVDVLSGKPGWYGNILVPYLGADGMMIGADYPLDLWAKFGGQYSTEEFLEGRATFGEDYAAAVKEAGGDDAPDAAGFQFGSLPEALHGTADVVLMMRAAHHFNRIDDGVFFDQALADIDAVLKPGGIVGVVQHRAPEASSDEWAIGNAGYIKQSRVIEVFEAAGFELVGESEINANPNDQPTEDDIVWRLPPSNDSPEAAAIGESDRMTLKFQKPE